MQTYYVLTFHKIVQTLHKSLLSIIYLYVKSFFRSFTKTWSWNVLQEITETLISINLTNTF